MWKDLARVDVGNLDLRLGLRAPEEAWESPAGSSDSRRRGAEEIIQAGRKEKTHTEPWERTAQAEAEEEEDLQRGRRVRLEPEEAR